MKSIELKSVKVSQKGQIAIPRDIQRELGIKKGDELILVREGRKLMLEKPERITEGVKDEFKDLIKLSETSLRKLWLNKEDEIWNEYLKRGKK